MTKRYAKLSGNDILGPLSQFIGGRVMAGQDDTKKKAQDLLKSMKEQEKLAQDLLKLTQKEDSMKQVSDALVKATKAQQDAMKAIMKNMR